MNMEMDEYNLILKTFSNCVSPSRRFHKIFWLTKYSGVNISVKFFCPNFPSTSDLKIYGEEEILSVIENNKEKFEEYCGKNATVLQFMLSFDKFLQHVQEKTRRSNVSSCVNLERDLMILKQIESVGFDKVTDINTDLLRVQFTYCDTESKQVHKLDILIPEDYPQSEPQPVTSLPDTWSPKPSVRFIDLYTDWLACIKEYLPAWRQLEELDRLCWVLDPDPPTPGHMYRRLAAGPSLSIQVEIDPSSPGQLPKIKFFGPDSKVHPLREKLCENADDWDIEDPLLANLENILDITFPDKTNITREDLKIDCGICYGYSLEGATPSTICRTESCSACFHEACAYDWLRSLAESRTTLDTIFGKCPYCSSPLSVRIPK